MSGCDCARGASKRGNVYRDTIRTIGALHQSNSATPARTPIDADTAAAGATDGAVLERHHTVIVEKATAGAGAGRVRGGVGGEARPDAGAGRRPGAYALRVKSHAWSQIPACWSAACREAA